MGDRWLGRALDGLIVGLATWQVLSVVAIRIELPFRALWPLAPLALVAGALAARFGPPMPARVDGPGADRWRWVPAVSLTIAGAAAVAWWTGDLGWPSAWAAGVAHLALTRLLGAGPIPVAPSSRAGWEVPLAVGVLLMLGTWFTHRPDGDDGYYLNAVVSTLRWRELPVFGFDGMHGDPSLPFFSPVYWLCGWELGIAALCAWTGLHPGDAVYLVVPTLACVAIALTGAGVLRAWFGRPDADAALIAFAVLLLCWGGNWVTHANFGPARLFQGKSVLVTVAVPLVAWAAIRFARAPSAASFGLLTAAQLGAVGTSTTGLILAPLVAGLAALGELGRDRRSLGVTLVGPLSTFPVVGLLLVLRADLTRIPPPRDSAGRLLGLIDVLDASWRAPLALCAILALPVLAGGIRAPGARSVQGFTLAFFAVVLSPTLNELFVEHLGKLYSWRTTWAIPIPLLVAAGFAAAGRASLDAGSSPIGWAARGATGMAALAFLFAGPWVWSEANQASFAFHRWKVPAEELEVARRVVAHSGPDGLTLANAQVALRVAGLPDAPALIVVRRMYLHDLTRAWGEQETRARSRMLDATFERLDRRGVAWLMRELDRRCVDAFVPLTTVLEQAPLRRALTDAGFRGEAIGRYTVMTRGRGTCDASRAAQDAPMR